MWRRGETTPNFLLYSLVLRFIRLQTKDIYNKTPVNIANFIQGCLYYLRLVGNRFVPRFVKRPFPRDHLQEIRQTDGKRNAEHSPPKDEYIDLRSIWAVEFYTPNHIEELIRRLEHLGWTKDESRNPVRSLKHRGVSQFYQSWSPLGRILPRDDPNAYFPPPLRRICLKMCPMRTVTSFASRHH